MKEKNGKTKIVDPAGNPAAKAGEHPEPHDQASVDLSEKYSKKRDKQSVSYREVKKQKDQEKEARENKLLVEDAEKCRKLLEEWEKSSQQTIKKLDKDVENLDAGIEKEIASREDFPKRYYAAVENVQKAEAALQAARVELNEIQSENGNSQSRESERRREKVRLENRIRDLLKGIRRREDRIFPPLPIDVRCPIRSCGTSLPSKAIYPHRTDFGNTIEIGENMLMECPSPICRKPVRINRITGDVSITYNEYELGFFSR